MRKADHHARRALGDEGAVVLRGERVELFPGQDIVVDVARFLADAERAMREPDAGSCATIAAQCQGELLPDSPYETPSAAFRAAAETCWGWI